MVLHVRLVPTDLGEWGTMKKKPEVNEEKHELEIIKAVAQAWHGRCSNNNSTSSRQQTNEFDAYRNKHRNKPTRFKLEAMSKASKETTVNDANWDFGQSLWDSYELVMISKRLESAGLVLDKSMSGAEDDQYLSSSSSSSSSKRRKESKNSLRKLLISRMSSSKRFDVNTPPEDDDDDDDDDLDQF